MNIINLPPVLPGDLDLEAINRNLQSGEVTLEGLLSARAQRNHQNSQGESQIDLEASTDGRGTARVSAQRGSAGTLES